LTLLADQQERHLVGKKVNSNNSLKFFSWDLALPGISLERNGWFSGSAKTEKVLVFLPRDARSASALLLSYVVRPSVRLSVTLMYAGHIG